MPREKRSGQRFADLLVGPELSSLKMPHDLPTALTLIGQVQGESADLISPTATCMLQLNHLVTEVWTTSVWTASSTYHFLLFDDPTHSFPLKTGCRSLAVT